MAEVDSLKNAKNSIAVIEKTLPGVKIFNLGEDTPSLDIKRYPTGSFKIDDITGGGLPEGRIIELYGAESSGKTSINLVMAGAYTRQKIPVLFIDAEHAFDKEYAQNLGVDMDYLFVTQPDYGEQAFSILEGAVKSGSFRFIVVDSVAALTPKSEIGADLEGNGKIAAQAAMMSRGLRNLISTISNSKCTVSFINQIRVKIGGFAPGMSVPMSTTGGTALKFYASIRMDVRKAGDVKRKDLKIGQEIKVRTIKNKTFAPFRETVVTLMLDEENGIWGIDAWSEIFDVIVDKDMLGSRQSYITLRGTKIKGEAGVPGKELLKLYLQEHDDEFQFLAAKVKNKDYVIEKNPDGSIDGLVLQNPVLDKVEEIEESNIDDLISEEGKVNENSPEENESLIDIQKIINDLEAEGKKVEPKSLISKIKENGGELTWAQAKEEIKNRK